MVTSTSNEVDFHILGFGVWAEVPGGSNKIPAVRIRTSRNARRPDERGGRGAPPLKGFRRIFSRFEKFDVIFLGFIVFARIFDALR